MIEPILQKNVLKLKAKIVLKDSILDGLHIKENILHNKINNKTYKIYKNYLTMMIASTFSTIQSSSDDTYLIIYIRFNQLPTCVKMFLFQNLFYWNVRFVTGIKS